MYLRLFPHDELSVNPLVIETHTRNIDNQLDSSIIYTK